MRGLKFVALAGLALVAACGRKTAENLPPPPVEQVQPETGVATAPATGTTGPSATGAAAGSREDFLRSVQSDRVLFAYDSYELDSAARAVLDTQAEWLSRFPNVRVTVEGHADERGTREYNLALGERRANEIRTYLTGRGVQSGRIETVSYGKERPAVEGSSEDAWAQNRRGVTVPGGGIAS